MGVWLGDGSFNTRLNALAMGRSSGARRGPRGGVLTSPTLLRVSVCPTISEVPRCGQVKRSCWASWSAKPTR